MAWWKSSYARWTGPGSSSSFLPGLGGRSVPKRLCFLVCWHDSAPATSSTMPVTTTVTASSIGQPMLLQFSCREVVLGGGLDEIISLLNRVTRSLAKTPKVVVPLLLSADMENCRTPLFLLVAALSPMWLSVSPWLILGILISSPVISQFHPRVIVSLLHQFINPLSSTVHSFW